MPFPRAREPLLLHHLDGHNSVREPPHRLIHLGEASFPDTLLKNEVVIDIIEFFLLPKILEIRLLLGYMEAVVAQAVALLQNKAPLLLQDRDQFDLFLLPLLVLRAVIPLDRVVHGLGSRQRF